MNVPSRRRRRSRSEQVEAQSSAHHQLSLRDSIISACFHPTCNLISHDKTRYSLILQYRNLNQLNKHRSFVKMATDLW